MSERRARIAVLGAGWWSQGWHLPHLSRNPEVKIAAIIEPNPNPRSAITARARRRSARSTARRRFLLGVPRSAPDALDGILAASRGAL